MTPEEQNESLGIFSSQSKQASSPVSSTEVLGMYTKPAQQQGGKRKSIIVNRRSFIRGGVNKGTPAYLLKHDQWSDSLNMVFDYDKARALPAFQTVDAFIATPSDLPSTGPNQVLPKTFNIPGLLFLVPLLDTPGLANFDPVFCYFGACPSGFSKTVTLPGLPSVNYNWTIRCRGLTEQGAYDGVQVNPSNPFLFVGGTKTPSLTSFFRLTTESQYFFLNGDIGGTQSPYGLAFETFDYGFSFLAHGGSQIALDVSNSDELQLCGPIGTTNPPTVPMIVTDDNPTYPIQIPQPYIGQFIQLDVINVSQ